MKTVIEMAKEAGFMIVHECDAETGAWYECFSEEIERFAELVRADEREAQIREVDWTSLMRQGGLVTWGDADELGDRVVATIRARGEASIRSET